MSAKNRFPPFRLSRPQHRDLRSRSDTDEEYAKVKRNES